MQSPKCYTGWNCCNGFKPKDGPRMSPWYCILMCLDVLVSPGADQRDALPVHPFAGGPSPLLVRLGAPTWSDPNLLMDSEIERDRARKSETSPDVDRSSQKLMDPAPATQWVSGALIRHHFKIFCQIPRWLLTFSKRVPLSGRKSICSYRDLIESDGIWSIHDLCI